LTGRDYGKKHITDTHQGFDIPWVCGVGNEVYPCLHNGGYHKSGSESALARERLSYHHKARTPGSPQRTGRQCCTTEIKDTCQSPREERLTCPRQETRVQRPWSRPAQEHEDRLQYYVRSRLYRCWFPGLCHINIGAEATTGDRA
jgi:hypothetical protein